MLCYRNALLFKKAELNKTKTHSICKQRGTDFCRALFYGIEKPNEKNNESGQINHTKLNMQCIKYYMDMLGSS